MKQSILISKAPMNIGDCHVLKLAVAQEERRQELALLDDMYVVTAKSSYMGDWWQYELTKMPI